MVHVLLLRACATDLTLKDRGGRTQDTEGIADRIGFPYFPVFKLLTVALNIYNPCRKLGWNGEEGTGGSGSF